MSDEIYESMVQPRGPAYRSSQIRPWSHYREPVDDAQGRLAGNSRIWGDASQQVQSRVIDGLLDASRQAGLSPREAAYVLATARQESGFNPDAAAGTTSAAGIGQFVDDTGRAYGINGRNRFDVGAQSTALVEHYIDNRNLTRSRGQGDEYIYAYHHDGPSLAYGGLGLSRREIMPRLDEYERFVRQQWGLEQCQETGQTQGRPEQAPPATDAQRPQSHPPAQPAVLKQGSAGQEVWGLQVALNALGYRGADGQPLETRSGVFGQQTDHAVRDFQRAHGLEPVDGKVGPDTRAAMAQAAQRPLVSEATHPNHGLYQAISRQLPEGPDPRVAANITLQALENGITRPDQLQGLAVRGSDVHLQGQHPGARVTVDMGAPTPDLQAMSDHMRTQTEQRVQDEQRRQQQTQALQTVAA